MSPRTAEQNAQIRAASRERIVEHALEVFAEHGYERASVRMIASAAGISQGLLYNYFDGKQALLHAIFEESMRDVQASFALADAAPPAERLERLIRGSFEILRSNIAFWRLSYGVRMQPAVLEGLGQQLHEWTATIRRTLHGYLRDAGVPSPDIEAAALFALIDGISQHYVLDPDRYPLEAVTELVIARYADSARATGGSRVRRHS
jgi:AcrR family transcriptional regulator